MSPCVSVSFNQVTCKKIEYVLISKMDPRQYVLSALRKRIALQQQIESLQREKESLDQEFIEWMEQQKLRNIRLGDGTIYSIRSYPDINYSQKSMEPIIRKYIRNPNDVQKCLQFTFSSGKMAYMQRLAEFLPNQVIQQVMRDFDQINSGNRRKYLTKQGPTMRSASSNQFSPSNIASQPGPGSNHST